RHRLLVVDGPWFAEVADVLDKAGLLGLPGTALARRLLKHDFRRGHLDNDFRGWPRHAAGGRGAVTGRPQLPPVAPCGGAPQAGDARQQQTGYPESTHGQSLVGPGWGPVTQPECGPNPWRDVFFFVLPSCPG